MQRYFLHYVLSFTFLLCYSRLDAYAASTEDDHNDGAGLIPHHQRETQPTNLRHGADFTEASIVGSSDDNRALRAARKQGAEVSSVVPETHSQFQDGETTRRLSLDIYDPSGLKSVKFIVNLQGQATRTGTLNVSGANKKRRFAFTIHNVPEGQHSWEIKIVTKSKNSKWKKQTLGPFDFSVLGEFTSGMNVVLRQSGKDLLS